MGLKPRKPQSETDRIRNMLIGMFVAMMLIITGLIAVGIYALKDIRTQNEKFVMQQIDGIKVINGKDGLTITGQQGVQGIQGVQGPQGVAGQKGDEGTTGQSGVTVVGPQGEKGDKGDNGETGAQGPAGEPGKTVYMRENPLTGQTECRYAGDRAWTECEQ